MDKNVFDGTRVVRSRGRAVKPWKVILAGGYVLYRFTTRDEAIDKLADMRARSTDGVKAYEDAYKNAAAAEARIQRAVVEAGADPA